MKKAIGGYLELELPRAKRHYHRDVVPLNTARNAFEYILRLYAFDKVYLPYYCCEVLLEPLKKLSIPYDFYSIDAQLSPILPSKIGKNSAVLLINYFGIKTTCIENIVSQYKNVIIDNSHAFFEMAMATTSTFYSPRKFFGLPDGGFASVRDELGMVLERDNSHMRFSHLIERIDCSAEFGYPSFVSNDRSLSNQPIKRMSHLTERLLMGIDYEKIQKIRLTNFQYLASQLSELNKLTIDPETICSPLVYPLYIQDGGLLKKKLIEHRVYIPTYWENMRPYIIEGSQEALLITDLVPLPIDQRLTKEDLDFMLKLILD